MIAGSIALSTLVDALILGVLIYSFWAFRKYRRDALIKEFRVDFLLISFGFSALGLSYILPLLLSHIAPLVLSPDMAADSSKSAQAALENYFAPVAFVAIVVGVSRHLLFSGSMHRQIQENQKSLKQMASDAQVAVEKLNQREVELSEKNANFQLALKNM